MGRQRNKPADAGVVSRLAGRGEDAITRLMDELGRNSIVTDALTRAMSARGVVDETTRKALAQVGLAAADEISQLRAQLETLEQRLSKLEAAGSRPSPARAGTAPSGTKRSTGSSTTKKTGTAERSATSTRSRSSAKESGSAGG